MRAVFRDSKSTYEQLVKKANLKSLYERRLQDIACLMFKVRHNLRPPTVKNFFSLKSSTYNLRGAFILCLLIEEVTVIIGCLVVWR